MFDSEINNHLHQLDQVTSAGGPHRLTEVALNVLQAVLWTPLLYSDPVSCLFQPSAWTPAGSWSPCWTYPFWGGPSGGPEGGASGPSLASWAWFSLQVCLFAVVDSVLTRPPPEGLHRQVGFQRVQGPVHGSERLEAELHDVRPGPQWHRGAPRDVPGTRGHGWEGFWWTTPHLECLTTFNQSSSVRTALTL